MGHRVKNSFYTEFGTAKDIETIVRVRPWIEDIVKSKHGNFTESKLFTDYDAKSDIFSFKIDFYR